ncbi:MAG: hypothetical protein ACYTGB_04070 [Planctomycetota bacterium]|jgi:hypothetical protein
MPEDPNKAAYTDDERRMVEEELEDLRHEIEHFQNEKERVRKLVSHMGGVPTFNTKVYNVTFILALVVCFVVSLVWFEHELIRLAMIEAATALVSLKLLLLMHNQSKVNHLQLWILTSAEWRLNEILKYVKPKD